MSVTSEIEAQIPEGYSVQEDGGRLLVVGPLGYYRRPVPDVEEVAAAVAQIQAQVDKVSPEERADLEARAPRVGDSAVRSGRRCEHTDVDNRGTCYGCGAYLRDADVGQVMRRSGMVR